VHTGKLGTIWGTYRTKRTSLGKFWSQAGRHKPSFWFTPGSPYV
jgi:hypothetical protein